MRFELGVLLGWLLLLIACLAFWLMVVAAIVRFT